MDRDRSAEADKKATMYEFTPNTIPEANVAAEIEKKPVAEKLKVDDAAKLAPEVGPDGKAKKKGEGGGSSSSAKPQVVAVSRAVTVATETAVAAEKDAVVQVDLSEERQMSSESSIAFPFR